MIDRVVEQKLCRERFKLSILVAPDYAFSAKARVSTTKPLWQLSLLALAVPIFLATTNAPVRAQGAQGAQGTQQSLPSLPGLGTSDSEQITRLTHLGKEAVELKVQVVPEKRVTSDVTVPGNIVAIPHSEYKQHPVLAGRISKLLVSLGDSVGLGQELAWIDSPEINRLAAETLLSRAQLEAEIAHSQAVLDDEVNQSSSKHRLATAYFRRIKMLVDERIGAKKDLEMAQSELEVADTRLNAARKKRHLVLAALKEKLKLTMEPLRHRLKLLGLKEADIERLLREKRTVVSVPICSSHKGLITDVAATVGQSVDPSNTLFVISDLSRVWIRANVYEPDIGRIRKGQIVSTTVASLPSEHFEGTLSFVASEVDPDLRTLGVCAEIANPTLRLKPGMYGQVQIHTTEPSSSVLIPREAMLQHGSTTYVFLDTPAGFVVRTVRLGRSFGDLVEILVGLSPGDRVVVQGAFQLDGELLKRRGQQAASEPSTLMDSQTPDAEKHATPSKTLSTVERTGTRQWNIWPACVGFALGVFACILSTGLLLKKRSHSGRNDRNIGTVSMDTNQQSTSTSTSNK